MKILIIHNFYSDSSPSGENIVVQEEAAMLEARGHEVIKHNVANDKIANAGLFLQAGAGLLYIFNPFALLKLRLLIHKFRPDVVHVHNIFPLLSPAIFYGVSNTPVVVTLHNYRLGCINGQFRRGNQVCTKCLDHRVGFHALIYRCYRNSFLYSLPMVLSKLLHDLIGTWKKKVDCYIALTEFQKKMIIKTGIKPEKITVRPNYFKGNESYIPLSERSGSVTFIGRISEEKGIKTLLNAWPLLETDTSKLSIVGEGPLLNEVKLLAENISNIELLGRLTSDECITVIKNSKILVVPSIWFEGFPMVIREAFAHGVPILASNIGSLSDILSKGGGLTFKTNDEIDLVNKLQVMLSDEALLKELSEEAFLLYREQFSEDKNYHRLMKIYSEVIKVKND